MIGWLLISILSALITLAGMVYFYTGAYKSVEISGPAQADFKMLYQEHIGPYHGINESIEQVEAWAVKRKIDCPKTFGEFLDDPLKTEEQRLRSHVGCLVDSPPSDLPKHLAYKEKTSQNFLQGRFAGAPSIGPFVVYPDLYAEVEKRQLVITGPAIEVYAPAGPDELVTEYYLPVAKSPTEPVGSGAKD